MTIREVKVRLKRMVHKLVHSHSVLSQIDDYPHIFYFGVPMHPNLGDLAQCMCIRKFLAENYPDYKVIEIDSKVFMDHHLNLRARLKNKVKLGDVIFFQSGYCTQDLGGVEDLMHQAVIQDYPNNKLIMLPQTVYFKSASRKEQASRIYNRHDHLLFLARDRISFEISKEMFPNLPLYVYPDIVTTLIGKYHFNKNRKGILMCTRNDLEKNYSDTELESLKYKLEAYDTVDQIDTTISEPMTANSSNMEEYIENYIGNLASYRLVVTDRYHGTIFSLVANTPVIVIKTTDHKVTTGVEWFKGIYDENVMYADNLEDVPKMAGQVLSRLYISENKPYFDKQYYGKLKQLIQDELG